MTKMHTILAERGQIFRWMEVIFEAQYLLFAVFIGLHMLWRNTGVVGTLSGAMALVLAGGDAVHLIPRMIATLSRDRERFYPLLGLGKLLTSITMTLFYVLLWKIGTLLFAPTSAREWTTLVLLLAGLRIALCLCKQNGWACPNPPVRWAVFRNLPFLLLGVMTAFLFGYYSHAAGPLGHMWLAIALSFAFYLPVVIGVHKKPKIGMLMIPKTCAYVWMLIMCAAL